MALEPPTSSYESHTEDEDVKNNGRSNSKSTGGDENVDNNPKVKATPSAVKVPLDPPESALPQENHQQQEEEEEEEEETQQEQRDEEKQKQEKLLSSVEETSDDTTTPADLPNMDNEISSNLKLPLEYPISTVPFAEMSWEIPRWQELQDKRLALCHQRVHLERRLFEFQARQARVVNHPSELPQNVKAEAMAFARAASAAAGGSNSGENNRNYEKKESRSAAAKEEMQEVSGSAWRLGRFRRRRRKRNQPTKPDPESASGGARSPAASSVDSSDLFQEDLDNADDSELMLQLDYPERLFERSPTETVRWTGPVNDKLEPDGFGRMLFADGQVYIGEVVAGQRQGQGKNIWPHPSSRKQKQNGSNDDPSENSESTSASTSNSQWYTGEWHQDSRWGRGTHRWPDGRIVTGQWQSGHLHGRIFYGWPDGSTYDGDAASGKKHGRGVHTYADGRVYAGQYHMGREHGFGTLTEADQTKYRGQFQNGQRHGFGIQIWKEKTYDGQWRNNIAHGRGKLTWRNGACYAGEFRQGKYHGRGSYRDERGRKFVGEWEQGIRQGQGQQFWPGGQSYTGGFFRGSRHGFGSLKELDGSLYAGGWAVGERSGLGMQRLDDGALAHIGLWKDGRPFYYKNSKARRAESKLITRDDLAIIDLLKSMDRARRRRHFGLTAAGSMKDPIANDDDSNSSIELWYTATTSWDEGTTSSIANVSMGDLTMKTNRSRTKMICYDDSMLDILFCRVDTGCVDASFFFGEG